MLNPRGWDGYDSDVWGLTAYGIGADRGYVTREQARERTIVTLRFLRDLPQGPQASGVAGHKGFFYHFLEMDSGLRAGDCEVSTVDTALLLCGALYSQAYFTGEHPLEAEIRRIADELTTRVDWRWAQTRPPSISLGWTPEAGFLPYDWRGYNEAAVVYLLALGHPTRPVEPGAWGAWTKEFRRNWATFYGSQGLQFAPLFGHQYSSVWVDFRGIRDAFTRRHGIDYYENTRRAAYSQRAYAMLNPRGWDGYDSDVWGLTACNGPANVIWEHNGQRTTFSGYAARGADVDRVFDDGTLAPTAAISSIVFSPQIVLPAIQAMYDRYGQWIYSKYGFVDAFNPTFELKTPLRSGHVVPGEGWIDNEYLGIDQGPILLMLENYRTGFVWKVMRSNPHIREGLKRAGFTGGWLEADAKTSNVDATAAPGASSGGPPASIPPR
jgi:hypothetical protein